MCMASQREIESWPLLIHGLGALAFLELWSYILNEYMYEIHHMFFFEKNGTIQDSTNNNNKIIIIIIIWRSLLPCFSNRDILQWLGATQSPSTIVLCCDFNPFLSSLLFFFLIEIHTLFKLHLFHKYPFFLMLQYLIQNVTLPLTHFVFLPSSSGLW